MWQSFTAGQNAFLVKVEAHGGGQVQTGTLEIYVGEGTAGELLHQQTYTTSSAVNWKSISLTNPVQLIEGQQYTIRFTNYNWDFSNDPYAGGVCNWNATLDYAFKTYIVTSVEDNTTLAIGNGRVGIGTNTPREKLEVVGNICHTGSIGACSDKRYKTDFQTIANPLEKIQQLNGLYYNWKQSEFPDKQFTDERQLGVIAQEVEVFFPEIVMTDDEGYKSVDYSKLTPVLLEAIKEQQTIIQNMEAKMHAMEAGLLSKLAALESKMDSGHASLNADE